MVINYNDDDNDDENVNLQITNLDMVSGHGFMVSINVMYTISDKSVALVLTVHKSILPST